MDIPTIIATAILLGGLVVGIRQLVLVGRQVRIMSKQMRNQLDWDRKNVTFEYLAKYSNELEGTNLKLHSQLKLLRQDGSQIDLSKIKKILEDDEMRSHLFNLVSYCDQLALGIAEQYFDENIAYESLCVAITATYKSLISYLDWRRNETKIKVGGHFEVLAKNWIERMQSDTRIHVATSLEDNSKSIDG